MRPLARAGALLLLCTATPALAAPALAATTPPPAVGSAASALGLLSVSAGGHTFDVATIELVSDTVASPPSAQVVVTPLTVDGTAYGKQTIGPGEGPTTVPSMPTSALSGVPGVVSVVAPAITATAATPDSGPTSSAGAGSFGGVEVLGIPVALGGAAEAVTGVSSSAATATKSIEVSDVALPSIAALLGDLGLDLSKVPLDALLTLVDQLDLALSGAFSTAMSAVDGAQAEVSSVTATLTAAVADQATATAAVDGAVAQLTAALAGSGLSETAFAALPQVSRDLIPGAQAAYDSLVAARSALDLADAALAAAQAAVDAAQTALTSATATLRAAVDSLLDGVPVLSLERMSVATSALAKSASAGGQEARITGGEITGLEVLGTDVLDAVLGSSTVDVLDLTSDTVGEITAVVDGLAGTLAGVLSDVTGLELTAPVIDVLGKATRTGVAEGFGEAETVVTALSVGLPRITLPTALALPGAADLPAFEGVAPVDGVLSSLEASVDLVQLRELSRYRPALTAGPGGGSAPTLPNTGGAPAAGLAGLVLIAAAAGMTRLRRRTAAPLA